jgi:transposase-like protein
MLPYGNGFRGSINPTCLYCCKRVSAFLIDETMLQIGSNEAWLWVAMEPIHKQILGLYISRHKEYDNCRERHLFLSSLIEFMVIDIPFIAMVEEPGIIHEACV